MGTKIPVSVLVVIHTPNLQILQLERATTAGFWQSVTGSMEAGERPVDTACREVREETGIIVAPDDMRDWKVSNRFEIYHQWRHRFLDGVTHNLEHVFSLCVAADVPVLVSPEEHAAWRWLGWREAAEACFSWSNRDAIHMLAQDALAGRCSLIPAKQLGQ